MEVRSVVARLVLGVALTGVAALIVFVGVPWLTAPAPEQLLLSPGGILEQALGRQAGLGSERTEGMLLREEAPEHPVMGLTAWVSEKEANQAETGELPAPLSADKVAGAMSEFVRVASAPDVDWEEDDRGSDKDVERAEPVSQEATVEGKPEVAATPERETAAAEGTAGSGSTGEETAPEVVEASESGSAARDEESAGPDAGALAADAGPEFSPVGGEAAMKEDADEKEASETPPPETGSPERDLKLTTTTGRSSEGAPMVGEDAILSGGARQPRTLEAGQVGKPQPGLPSQTQGVVVPHSLRGVMGYRLPLISRQEVPDQVVSGVLIPAHTTYVILRKGEWELVGLSAEEIEILRRATETAQGEELKGIR